MPTPWRLSRENVISVAQTISAEVLTILTLRQQVLMRIDNVHARLNADALADMKQQIDALIGEGFVRTTPLRWLSEIPRYLTAIEARIKKLSQQGTESQMAIEVAQHAERWRQMDEVSKQKKPDYRWMIEEWRVSVFAQNLGTQMPISAKRIEKYLASSDAAITVGR